MYVSFMNLEKMYDKVDKEILCWVRRMYGVNGKLLEGIKSFMLELKQVLDMMT